MKKVNRKKYRFNLVEIALAMGVIALGLSSIMGVVPVVLNTARDSVSDNEVANIANNFLGTLQMKLAQEGSNNWGGTNSVFLSALPDSRPWTAKTKRHATYYYTVNSTSPTIGGNFYTVTSAPELAGGKVVYFYCPNANYGSGTDFAPTAMVQVWRETPEDFSVGGVIPSSAKMKEISASLVVEVAYPVTKPYSAMEKRIYRLDLFNTDGLFQ